MDAPARLDLRGDLCPEVKMQDLDNLQIHRELDPSGQRLRLQSLARQCRDAWEQSQSWAPPEGWPTGEINRVFVGGMGGSAIAGDLASDFAAWQGGTPLTVARDFNVSFPLGPDTLFIPCSFSGNTEETLAMFHQARASGAPIFVVAGGGILLEEARARGYPCLVINATGEPRSAMAYNLVLLLGAIHRLGMLDVTQADVDSLVATLEYRISSLAVEVPEAENPAKQLARELEGKVVATCGGGLFSGVARRWKTQLNENAKVWAFFETMPELLHNAVEVYGVSPKADSGLMVLLLQPAAASAELAGRYQVVAELLRRRGVPYKLLLEPDGPPLSQLLGMSLLGDYVSYYLAILQGRDPSPNPVIDLGKQLLPD